MPNPHIYAALAHERHQTFLAQAETDRRARQARLHRRQAGTPGARRSPLRLRPAWLRAGRSRPPGRWPRSAMRGRPVVLRDGSTVLIRQVHSADAPLLADGFARLSTRSRQLRFLTPKKELSPAELRYFTDVDHHDHEALGALDAPRRPWCRYRPLRPGRRRPAGRRNRGYRSSTTGRGEASAPNWWLSCLSVPAPKASAVSPRWSRPTIRRWQDCCARSGPTLSAMSRAPCGTRSCWDPRNSTARLACSAQAMIRPAVWQIRLRQNSPRSP